MKAWKASHDPDSIKDLQKLLTATEENAVARMTALNRKAVAAQEVAQSAQQQLTHSAAQHDQELAELRQQLNASLQNVACLQQENTAAGSLHLKEMADLQAHHAQMLTDMESAFKTRMGSRDSDHVATIRDLQAQMASAAQQHRQTMAEVEVHYKRQLAAQRNIYLAKSTEASELSKVEVVSVRGYWKQQLAAAEKQCTDALQTAEAAHAAQLTQLRATGQKQCTNALETAEAAHSAELTQLRAELATVQKQWADGAEFDWAGTIDNKAADSKQPAAAKQCTLLQFWSLTTTTETSSAAVDTIPAVKMGAATSDKLQHQQQLSTGDPWSDSLSSSNVQLQSDAEVDVKPSNSSGSDTSSDTSKGPAQQSLQKNAFGSELIASNSCAQQDAEGDTCTSSGSSGEQPQGVAASVTDQGLSTGNTLTEPMHDVANTADTAVASQASSLGKTADTAVESQASSDNKTAPAQADSVKVAVPVQASSTDQTMPAQAGSVKKTVPDEANTMTSCTQLKAVGEPVQATVTQFHDETITLADSNMFSTLFSSPWDEAAAAAEIDVMDEVVDYEQLWIKGPQSWCDLDDDWGIDDDNE